MEPTDDDNHERAALMGFAWKRASGCWEWTGSLRGGGYGNFSYKGRTEAAHRASFRLNIGTIPHGAMVCHRCDNRKCVNPEHLFIGSALVNAKDRDEKGRHSSGVRNTTRTTDKPFSIRPTDGTALQRFIDLCRAKQISPKPAIEEWARLAEKKEREK